MIGLLILQGFSFAQTSTPTTVAVTAQAAPAYYQDIQKFLQKDKLSPVDPGLILFTGSSSFTMWKDLQQAFPNYPLLNRAFGGSTLPDLIRYTYDVVLPYRPKQVVIYCGENDLANADTLAPEEVLNRVKTLFSMIRINLPQTRISYVSIKPSPVRIGIQKRVLKANALIKSFMVRQTQADFIDIYEAMLDKQGNMREELYLSDRLHMQAAGYEIWKKIINPYLLMTKK